MFDANIDGYLDDESLVRPVRGVRLHAIDFCDCQSFTIVRHAQFHAILSFTILRCYYTVAQFRATLNFDARQSFPTVRRSLPAAQLCYAQPTNSCGQGRVKQVEKHESPERQPKRRKTASARHKKWTGEGGLRECHCE